MSHSKLRAALVAAAAAGVLALAACGESPTDATRTALAPPDDPATHVGPNSSPTAFIDVQDSPRVEGKCIKFSAARSFDPDYGDQSSLTFDWRFGDASGGTGRFPCHTYADNGIYLDSLTVTDMHGATGSTTRSLIIINANPETGSVTRPGSYTEGVSFQLSLDGATDVPADTSTLEYSFNCGVGGWTPWTHTHSATCPGIPDNGTYTLGGRVRDKDGGADVRRPPAVTVLNANPVCTFDYNQTGGWVEVLVGCDDVPADRWITCTFNWGDGSPDRVVTFRNGFTTSPEHRYARGSYIVTTICNDKDGGAASDTHGVTVPPAP